MKVFVLYAAETGSEFEPAGKCVSAATVGQAAVSEFKKE